MNAAPPVSQIPIASDPAQQSAAAPVNSVKTGGKALDFAAALRSAGAKPARRAAGHQPADPGSAGGTLPAPGNLSPPPAVPIAAASAAAPAAAALAVSGPRDPGWQTAATAGMPAKAADPNSGGASAGSAVAAPGAQGKASPGAELAAALEPPVAGRPAFSPSGEPLKPGDPNSGGASIDAPVTASGTQGAAGPGGELAQALGLPVADLGGAAAPRGDGAATATAGPGITAAGATAAGVAAAGITAAGVAGSARGAAAARAASATPAGAASGIAHKPMTAAAATAAFNAATSGPSTTDGSTAPSTTGAWTSTDATAQAVTAAAMAAAATGAYLSDTGFAGAADPPSAPSDELAAPAATGAARGAGRPNGAPALAVSADHAAAATAAKAAADTPAFNALADMDGADKRAPGASVDSPLLDTSGNAAAGAAQLSANTAGVADAAPTPTLKVAAGMDTPEFGQGLADRVSWMVDNNLNGAKLQVNPPQLGPIEVRIAVQGNHAQVWLTSHSAVTRDALESSSPKLREMLGAQGFGQVSVDISQRSYQERSAQPQPYDWTPSANRSPAAAAVQSTSSLLPRTASGAVDAYA